MEKHYKSVRDRKHKSGERSDKFRMGSKYLEDFTCRRYFNKDE